MLLLFLPRPPQSSHPFSLWLAFLLLLTSTRASSTKLNMKLSLKFRGNDGDQNGTQTQIMTAKVPITVLNNPFISGITATTTTNNNSTSDFSFSLSTNFPSGPTVKLSYSPSASLPFSLSLKSGLGIFGSPRHSPLVFSANFSLSPSPTTHTLSPLPSFFLHFKPQFGHFSLNKTVFSDNSNNNNNPLSLSLDNPQIEKGFVASPDGSSSGWQNLKLEPYGNRENHNDVVVPERKNNEKCGLSPGVAVMAQSAMPVTQGLLLNFRWGVNFPGKSGLKMPYLTVNKIGLERVEEAKQNEQKNTDETREGMGFWMRRDLESVEKENREMKRVLGEMKKGISNSNSTTREGSNGNIGNKLPQQLKSFQRRGKSNGNGRQENEKKQPNQTKQPQSVVASDLESELQKAIKAAASS